MSELEKPRGQMTPLAFPNSDMVTNLLNVFNEDLALVGFHLLRNCWISCMVWFGNDCYTIVLCSTKLYS